MRISRWGRPFKRHFGNKISRILIILPVSLVRPPYQHRNSPVFKILQTPLEARPPKDPAFFQLPPGEGSARFYPFPLSQIIHIWHGMWISLVLSLSHFAIFTIVKILFLYRETTQFWSRKLPGKNTPNPILTWITGNLNHFTINFGRCPSFFLGVI